MSPMPRIAGRRSIRPLGVAAAVTVLLALILPTALATGAGPPPSRGLRPCPGSNWPTYMGSPTRDSSAPSETTWSPAAATRMALLWNFTTGADVSASPSIVNGVVYIGSHDGFVYALRASNGTPLWKSYLGLDTWHQTNGISSTAAISGPDLYVGTGNISGNASLASLDLSNGTVRWTSSTGPEALGYYVWASPVVVGTHVYEGVSSKGDNPLVVGGLMEFAAASGTVLHRYNTTAPGTIGASIWTSPAYDATTGTIFVTTGNPGPNGSTWGNSILSFNAKTLKLTGNWTIPASQAITDGDFGATPVLFPSDRGTPLIAASDKNGLLYAWNRTNLGAGPLWTDRIAVPPAAAALPNLGPVAYAGGVLYVGSTHSPIGGTTYRGALRAINASTGAVIWTRAEAVGAVLGAPLVVDGTLVVGAGPQLQFLNATSGNLLSTFNVSANFQGPAAISHGLVVIGNANGVVYAFGPTSCRPGGRAVAGAPPGSGSPPATAAVPKAARWTD